MESRSNIRQRSRKDEAIRICPSWTNAVSMTNSLSNGYVHKTSLAKGFQPSFVLDFSKVLMAPVRFDFWSCGAWKDFINWQRAAWLRPFAARTGSSKLISHWNIPLTRYTCSQSNIVCSMGLRGQSGWKSIPSGLKFIPRDCSRVSKAFFVRSGFSDDNIKAAAANSASVRSCSCPMSKHVWGTKVPLGSDRWRSLRACTTFQQNRQGRVPAAPLTAHIAFKAASSPMRHRRRPNKKTLRPLWSVRRSPDSRGVKSWVMTFVKQLTPPCSLPTLLLRTIDTVCHKSSLVKPRWPCWISDQ